MLRSEMREKLKSATHGLLDSETDGTLNDLLDRAYQYAIPDMVGGELAEGEWTLTTTASTDTYTYPTNVHSVRMQPPRLGGDRWLTFETNPTKFWLDYDRDSASEAQPTGALFYGGVATLRPIPDQAYTIYIDVRKYRDALDDVTEIDPTTAFATIAAAAIEWLEDFDDVEAIASQERRLGKYIDRLHTRAHARPKTRDWRASF